MVGRSGSGARADAKCTLLLCALRAVIKEDLREMFKASAGKTLPTSIIGSLPRPSWYTAVLGAKSFLEAMLNARYREQYEDAVSVHLRAQETAGLDICTDGDAHYDEEVEGLSWTSYPITHMAGFDAAPRPTAYKIGALAYPRGHILHDFLEARVFPKIV